MKIDTNIDARYKLAYFNVNKRVRKLARTGFLSEKKQDPQSVNLHGRKDYRLSTEGFSYVIQYMTHPEDTQRIHEYMELMKKQGVSQEELEKTLRREFESILGKAKVFVNILNLINDQWGEIALHYKPGPELPSRGRGKGKGKDEPQRMLSEAKQATKKRYSTSLMNSKKE